MKPVWIIPIFNDVEKLERGVSGILAQDSRASILVVMTRAMGLTCRVQPLGITSHILPFIVRLRRTADFRSISECVLLITRWGW